MNLITDKLVADSGTIEKGETIIYGYYTQAELEFREDQRVIDVVKEIAEVVTVGSGETITASQFLNHFLFEPKKQYTQVSKLSGGEKRRLQLLKVLIKNPNFLILDEPTNDLDIQSLNILEDFLLNFGGCLILVSHDRYFMDQLVEHLFVFEGEGKIKDFSGNYTDYREDLEETERSNRQLENKNDSFSVKEQNNGKPVSNAPKTENKRKISFKEQKEYENLGKAIQLMETQRKNLTEQLNSGSGKYEELAAWAKEIEKLTAAIDEKEMRWLELEESMG